MPGSPTPEPTLPVTLRPVSSRVVHVVLLAAAGAWLAGTGALLTAGPVLLALAVLSHAAFWRAAVVVDDRGVRLLNVLRDVEVPWAALDDVTARWSLTLHAGGRTHQSWSATARSQAAVRQQARAQRRAARSGTPAGPPTDGADAESALAVVERHRERWVAAGRVPADGEVVVRWNVAVLVTVTACVAVALAAAVS